MAPRGKRGYKRSYRGRRNVGVRKAVLRNQRRYTKTTGKFAKKVKAIVSSLTEDKQAYTTTGGSLLKFNSGIDSAGDLITILPNISQGIQENQRIGDQIRAKNLNVKGFVKLDINDVSDSSKLPTVIVRMMIVTMKACPSFPVAQANYARLDTLLQKGGTTTGFSGALQDIYAPINRDVFTVHVDRKFYLNQSFINVTGPSPSTATVTQDVSKTIKFFNVNVKCKGRILKYDEDMGADVQPNNFGPFLILGYSYADGSSADIVDTKVGLCFDSTFNYEDM